MASYQDYLNQAFSSPQLSVAQRQYEAAQKQLSDLNAQLPNYQVQEYQKLIKNDPQLQQLNTQRSAAVGSLFSTPLAAQDQYKDIFDPVKRNALVAQATGNVLGQLSGYNANIEQRKQKSNDLANQALELLKSRIAAAQGGASSAADVYNQVRGDLKDVAKTQFSADQARANRDSGVTPVSLAQAGLYAKDGSQIGFMLFNPKTGQRVYTDIVGKQYDEKNPLPEGVRTGGLSYTQQNTNLFDGIDLNGGL